MNVVNNSHWQEGQFIRPHHFQQFQRNIFSSIAALTREVFVHPYGMIQYEFDTDLLNNENALVFKSLKVVMPSGYYIDLNNNAYLPRIQLDAIIKPEDNVLNIYLGLPHWQVDKANLSSREEIKNDKISRIYSLVESSYSDENTGFNEQNILVRNLNPRFFTDYDELVDYEKIQVARVRRDKLDKFTLEQNFIPPCFKINGSLNLKGIINEIAQDIVLHTAESNAKLHGYCEFKSMPHKFNLLIHKNKTINKTAVELNGILFKSNPTPFDVYSVFRKLVAELSVLMPGLDLSGVVEYSHVNLYECFNSMKLTINKMLKVELIEENYQKLQFTKEGEGLYQVTVNRKFINPVNEYYLAVKTKMHSDYVVRGVEKGESFKCIPYKKLEMQAIPGFKLDLITNLPNDLFREYNEYYFYINKQDSSLWKEWVKEGELKLGVHERLSGEEGIIDGISLISYYGRNNENS